MPNRSNIDIFHPHLLTHSLSFSPQVLTASPPCWYPDLIQLSHKYLSLPISTQEIIWWKCDWIMGEFSISIHYTQYVLCISLCWRKSNLWTAQRVPLSYEVLPIISVGCNNLINVISLAGHALQHHFRTNIRTGGAMNHAVCKFVRKLYHVIDPFTFH